MSRSEQEDAQRFGVIGTWWPAVVIALLLVLMTPWLVGPPCPRKVVIAAGDPQGAYHRNAVRYRQILARDGIELQIQPTSGAAENLRRVGQGAAALGFYQGGAAPAATDAPVETLASVYLEPVWVFARADLTTQRLTDLSGRTIAIGEAGSGTQPLAMELLTANGVLPTKPSKPSESAVAATRWLPLGGARAAEALQRGEIEAAFFVSAVNSPLVRRLLSDERLRLMDFVRAEAYESKFRFLTAVTLPRGAVDLARDLPAAPVRLLAPSASVIARDDLHPAVVPLVMQALEEVHGEGEVLAQPGEFPSTHHASFQLRPLARHYLQHGPSVLYRVLPFWAAVWVDRMKLLLLPLFTLLLPALRLAPPIYRWRVRRRIYRWYGMLREIDEKVRAGELLDPRRAQKQLDKISRTIMDVAVPMGYMEEFFNLRQHLDEVRQRLNGPLHQARAA